MKFLSCKKFANENRNLYFATENKIDDERKQNQNNNENKIINQKRNNALAHRSEFVLDGNILRGVDSDVRQAKNIFSCEI